ncbi:hypothetical protein HanRHA438_Chr13g0607281 [Helianthus annuus]|nr:hypothetical protein HanRHA438_Chr13g0607281 [Helianthus annuus]
MRNQLLPASIAFLAATLKSSTIRGISCVVSFLGGVKVATSMPPPLVNPLSVEDIGACPFG